MELTLAIAPIALTILCGYLLSRTGTVKAEGWSGIEAMSFRLLIPVVLITAIAKSDLALSEFAPFVGLSVAALVLAGLAVFLLRFLRSESSLPNPDFTTLFQTTTRWNGFIALAAAELLVGDAGLALVAAAMAVLIPLINVANIIVLVQYGTAKATVGTVIKTVAKNPLVQGCAIGIFINVSNIPLPDPILPTLDLIGRAALGVGLLAVGGAIVPARLFRYSHEVLLGIMLRQFLCPALFLGLALMFNLSALEVMAGFFVLSVPAASNGYIVAKQMGGNAELYADIVTWQTLISMPLLPILAYIAMG